MNTNYKDNEEESLKKWKKILSEEEFNYKFSYFKNKIKKNEN